MHLLWSPLNQINSWIAGYKDFEYLFYFYKFKKAACQQGKEALLFYMFMGRILKDTITNVK